MLSKTADLVQRNGALGLKGSNNKTKLPCTLCKASQSNAEGDVGGEIGDRNYDIVGNRRKRGEIEQGRLKLIQLGYGTTAAKALSKELGIVEPHPSSYGQPRALWDLTSTHSPMAACGPEVFHMDLLVSRVIRIFFVLRIVYNSLLSRHRDPDTTMIPDSRI